MSNFDKPVVSIIVTSYTMRRLGDIRDLLDSVKAQTYPNIETILIVERSRELFEKIKNLIKELALDARVLFSNDELGMSAARNLGIEGAKGDVVAFVDDDVVLSPYWAEEIVRTLKETSIIGVTGLAFPVWKNGVVACAPWFPKEFYWVIGCTAWFNSHKVKDVRNAWGMSMAFKREVFAAGCRFEPNFGLRAASKEAWGERPSEDVEFSLKAKAKTGKRIVYNPNVRVGHKISRSKLRLDTIVRTAFYLGRQRRMIKKCYINDPNILDVEKGLLKNVFSRLVPTLPRDLVSRPIMFWHRFSLTFVILLSVGCGYLTFKNIKRKYSELTFLSRDVGIG